METTVDKLEALVRKAENDLKFMNCKLEIQLTNAASKDLDTQMNPAKTIEAFEETKKELTELVKEYEELQQAQEEAHETISQEIQTVCQVLEDLEQRAGIPINTDSSIFTPISKKP